MNFSYELGLLWETGDARCNIPKDEALAIKYFMDGALAGHNLSFHAVGYCNWVRCADELCSVGVRWQVFFMHLYV